MLFIRNHYFILLIALVNAQKPQSFDSISSGYGCLLQCMGDCLKDDKPTVDQIRDCKIKCKSQMGNVKCLENEDQCDDVCKNAGKNTLRRDDSLERLHLSVNPSSTFKGSRIIEITWKNVAHVRLYVARFREANGTWMYQESNANSFIFVRPKTCTTYQFQVAYLVKNANEGILISPFSPVFSLEPTPTWSAKIASTPTLLYLNKSRPFIDETNDEKIDNASIVLRHKVVLPHGYAADDFKFVGKYWRIYHCDTEPNYGPLIVTFSKIVEDNRSTYVESLFPAFYGINGCTVINQLKSVTICDKVLPIPFDFIGKTYRIKLDCSTVEQLPCDGQIV